MSINFERKSFFGHSEPDYNVNYVHERLGVEEDHDPGTFEPQYLKNPLEIVSVSMEHL